MRNLCEPSFEALLIINTNHLENVPVFDPGVLGLWVGVHLALEDDSVPLVTGHLLHAGLLQQPGRVWKQESL